MTKRPIPFNTVSSVETQSLPGIITLQQVVAKKLYPVGNHSLGNSGERLIYPRHNQKARPYWRAQIRL